jgi:hypothetical protein
MRYSPPILYTGKDMSIELEVGFKDGTWVLAIQGPSTKRPGGSVTHRITVEDPEICGWLKAVYEAPDPPDYKAMLDSADAVVSGQALRVEALLKELDDIYKRTALDEQIKIQKINEIESYKAQVVSLTGQLQKALSDLEDAKKKQVTPVQETQPKVNMWNWLFRR